MNIEKFIPVEEFETWHIWVIRTKLKKFKNLKKYSNLRLSQSILDKTSILIDTETIRRFLAAYYEKKGKPARYQYLNILLKFLLDDEIGMLTKDELAANPDRHEISDILSAYFNSDNQKTERFSNETYSIEFSRSKHENNKSILHSLYLTTTDSGSTFIVNEEFTLHLGRTSISTICRNFGWAVIFPENIFMIVIVDSYQRKKKIFYSLNKIFYKFEKTCNKLILQRHKIIPCEDFEYNPTEDEIISIFKENIYLFNKVKN